VVNKKYRMKEKREEMYRQLTRQYEMLKTLISRRHLYSKLKVGRQQKNSKLLQNLNDIREKARLICEYELIIETHQTNVSDSYTIIRPTVAQLICGGFKDIEL